MRGRRAIGRAPLPVLALATAASALAAWSSAATGTGAARADALPAGATPTATVTSHDVTLDWEESELAGQDVSGYMIRRYDAVTGVPQAVLSACAGVVGTPTCVERGVPTGSWRYTVSPLHGAWQGAEGAPSAIVIVLL